MAPEHGDTAARLAATREDLARFEGRVMTELRGLHSSMGELKTEVSGQGERLHSVDQRLGRMEVEHAAAEQYEMHRNRLWDRWREWVAYATTTAAVAWSIFGRRNGG